MTLSEFIFVSGTLRKEISHPMHDLLTKDCEYVAEGCIQGKLYEVAGYPGAIESDGPGDIVKGEIYRIINNEKVLSKLDEYEECTDSFSRPHEYIRKKLLIFLPEGNTISAWIYIYNRDISQLVRIKNGDYPEYLKDKNEH